jgi:hypothetical protein
VTRPPLAQRCCRTGLADAGDDKPVGRSVELQLKFATYARRMIAAARLEPPKVISGSEAPARTTSRRGFSFFRGPPPSARLLASEKKPRRNAAGLEGENRRVLQLAREHVSIMETRAGYQTKVPFDVTQISRPQRTGMS